MLGMTILGFGKIFLHQVVWESPNAPLVSELERQLEKQAEIAIGQHLFLQPVGKTAHSIPERDRVGGLSGGGEANTGLSSGPGIPISLGVELAGALWGAGPCHVASDT